jgi:hypothetical protein
LFCENKSWRRDALNEQSVKCIGRNPLFPARHLYFSNWSSLLQNKQFEFSQASQISINSNSICAFSCYNLCANRDYFLKRLSTLFSDYVTFTIKNYLISPILYENKVNRLLKSKNLNPSKLKYHRGSSQPNKTKLGEKLSTDRRDSDTEEGDETRTSWNVKRCFNENLFE